MPQIIEDSPMSAGRIEAGASDVALVDARKTRPVLEHIDNKWSVLILNVL